MAYNLQRASVAAAGWIRFSGCNRVRCNMPSVRYYDILEISPDASSAVIRAAYRKLSREYHPDTNPDAERVRRFKQIQEAREVLSDPVKRARYDEQLEQHDRFEREHALHSAMCRAPARFAGPGQRRPTDVNTGGDHVDNRLLRSVLTVWKTCSDKPETVLMIGTAMLCTLLLAAVAVHGIRAAPASVSRTVRSDSRAFAANRPLGATVRGNLAAWTEPAQPRFGEDYRVMLTVHLLDTDKPIRVSDLIDGRIAGDDGLRRQIPYHADAPNASWIVADQSRERIASPDQVVNSTAEAVQFSFRIPAVEHPTRETIHVRSGLLPSSDYWELVVNRSR